MTLMREKKIAFRLMGVIVRCEFCEYWERDRTSTPMPRARFCGWGGYYLFPEEGFDCTNFAPSQGDDDGNS